VISRGLSAADQRVFDEGLRHDHAVSTTVRILDMDHRVLGEADGVISGSVDVDAGADVERSCSVEVLDPQNRLGLTSASPTQPVIFVNKQVQVLYRVRIPELGRWVDVPIFTGPITKADATDQGVSITGTGKESLLNEGTSISKTFKKGTKKSDVISQYLAAMGETQRQITAFGDRLTADLTISGVDKAWPVLRSLARQLGDSSNFPWLGYDGRGVCRLSTHSGAVRWVFDGQSITSTPKVTVDESSMRNYVRIVNNDKVIATAKAAPSDPFSAQSLARGGVPRWIREDVTSDITDKRAAQTLANSTLDSLMHAAVSVEFESLIVPHLEPRDVIRVVADTWEWDLQVTKFTIPLGASQAMRHGRNAQIIPKIKYAAKGRTR
jgi:hypothetical protein